jgi:NitT/TauT family transport system substrate-binding protein
VGLLVLLHKAGIPLSAVSIKTIGFTQIQSVAHHRVDAAVGYANNEPVFLRQQGFQVQEFDIYHWANIAGAGIAVGNAELAKRPGLVRAFVEATLRGMRETLAHPDESFRISEQAVPEIRASPRGPRAVLQRSLDLWRPERGRPLGWIDPGVWRTTAQLLYQYRQIPHPVSAGRMFTNRFIPRG